MIEAPSPEREIVEHGSILGANPNHRLVLLFISASGGAGWNFHQLVWQQKHGFEWQAYQTISAAQFQQGSAFRRWVSELQSFDPASSAAIVRVGEVDSFDPHYYRAVYTWRLLHLPTLALEVLQRCSDPFEPYARG